MQKVVEVKAIDGYKLWLKYEDGIEGHVDLSHLEGMGVFRAWGNELNFVDVRVDDESGAISWGSGLDICADQLYFKIRGMDAESYFESRAS